MKTLAPVRTIVPLNFGVETRYFESLEGVVSGNAETPDETVEDGQRRRQNLF